jgi:hypothetical protein
VLACSHGEHGLHAMIDWGPLRALGLSLVSAAAATYVGYRLAAHLAPRSSIPRRLVVGVGLLVALRLAWCGFSVVGGGRIEQLHGGWITARAYDFSGSKFWGGVRRWSVLSLRAGNEVLYEKKILHDDFDLDWRHSGDIDPMDDYRVRFRYGTSYPDRELRSLEVVVDYEEAIPSEVRELIAKYPSGAGR